MKTCVRQKNLVSCFENLNVVTCNVASICDLNRNWCKVYWGLFYLERELKHLHGPVRVGQETQLESVLLSR